MSVLVIWWKSLFSSSSSSLAKTSQSWQVSRIKGGGEGEVRWEWK